jgi:DNA-binding transcriptional LysR family regulator
VPTDEAHELFADASAVRHSVDMLRESARNLRRIEQGRLRVAMIHSLGLEVVPDAVAAFAARHPGVSIDLRTLHSEELVEALQARTSDIVIGYDAPRPRLAPVMLGPARSCCCSAGRIFPILRADRAGGRPPPARDRTAQRRHHRQVAEPSAAHRG